ncbi:MAG: hypothetical protein LAQ69_19125 [Acidobacteriia bacterium]|nr:hypothetical protein [Terriglobia bacterium]
MGKKIVLPPVPAGKTLGKSVGGTVHVGGTVPGLIGWVIGGIRQILPEFLDPTRPTLWSIDSVTSLSGGISFVVGGVFNITLKWHGPCPASEDPTYYTGKYRFNFTILGVSKGIPVSFAFSTPSMPGSGSRVCFVPPYGGYLVKDEIVGSAVIIAGGVATPIFGASAALMFLGSVPNGTYKAWGAFSGIEAGVDASVSASVGVMTFVEEITEIPAWADKQY